MPEVPEPVPSPKYQPITDNPALECLRPMRIFTELENKIYNYDCYCGVIATKWRLKEDESSDTSYGPFYYCLEMDREDWEHTVWTLDDIGYRYEIMAELPEGKRSERNFLEDLSRSYFGFPW